MLGNLWLLSWHLWSPAAVRNGTMSGGFPWGTGIGSLLPHSLCTSAVEVGSPSSPGDVMGNWMWGRWYMGNSGARKDVWFLSRLRGSDRKIAWWLEGCMNKHKPIGGCLVTRYVVLKAWRCQAVGVWAVLGHQFCSSIPSMSRCFGAKCCGARWGKVNVFMCIQVVSSHDSLYKVAICK